MQALFKFFLGRPLVVNLISIFVFLVGISTLPMTLIESFPNVTLDIVAVTTLYPGASPSDVERKVTDKIEDAIDTISGVKIYRSISVDNLSTVAAELDPNSSPAEKKKTLERIKAEVEKITDFPEDVERPTVEQLDFNWEIMQLAVIHPQQNELALRQAAEDLEDRLTKVPGVAEIVKAGYRDEEVLVSADPWKLSGYALSIGNLINSIRSSQVDLPAGDFDEPQYNYKVRTIGEAKTVEALKNISVRSNFSGAGVKLTDVANVGVSLKKENFFYRVNGQNSIWLKVFRNDQGNISKMSKAINQVVLDFNQSRKPGQAKAIVYNDYTRWTMQRLNVLLGNAWMGFFLVMGVLVLFFDFGTALLVASGIPFALLITLIFMKPLGITINGISLMGFVIVLGMLVDNGIAVSENAYRHIGMTKDRILGTLKGLNEVVSPVLLSSITTIFSFLPLAFMPGVIGKVMSSMPWVVIIALLASLWQSFFMVPSYITQLALWQKDRFREKTFLIDIMRVRYEKLARVLFRYRYRTVAGVVLFFILSMLLATQGMRFVFIPEEGIDTFWITTEAPEGTSLEKNAEYLKRIEDQIKKYPPGVVKNFATSVGTAIDASSGSEEYKYDVQLGQVMVFLSPPEKRSFSTPQLIERAQKEISALKLFKKITVEQEEGGPPSGKPIYIKFKGPDFKVLDQKASEIFEFIKKIPGTKEVAYSYEDQNPEAHLRINQAQVARLGLNNAQVATDVRAAFDGVVVNTMKVGKEDLDLRIKLKQNAKSINEIVNSMQIDNGRGGMIPLSQLVQVIKTQGPIRIVHEDSNRMISIQGKVDIKKVSAAEVAKKVTEKYKNAFAGMPDYKMEVSGELQDTAESITGLIRAVFIAMMTNYFLLMAFFNSASIPLTIFTAIPLSFIGIVFAFFLNGQPISFPALLGIVGLSGVVVNNSIILIDFIHILIREGKSTMDAVIEACTTRLRPIFLASFTTVFGVLPTAYGIGGTDVIVKPMALAFGAGLLTSTILTLFLIPCLYLINEDINANRHKIYDAIVGRFRKKNPA